MARVIFWLAAVALAYTYCGYPLLVWAWSLVRRRKPTLHVTRPLPTVSIVTVAHNEAARIERRLDDLLALDYPADRIEIIVASDGSTDDTVTRVRRRHGTCGRIHVLDLRHRRGKSAALAEAVRATHHEILVLCDTRQRLRPDALVELIARFDDPQVGAVSGTLAPAGKGDGVARGLGAYWRYETFLRRCESDIDSLVGATGALYAIRRELFVAPAPDTVLDDVAIPLAALRAGYRVVFAPRARAIEETPASARAEWRRRVRTLAGCFQLFARESWLFDPRRDRIWLQMMSHKALRLVAPALLVLLLVSSWALAGVPAYRIFLSGQLVCYLAGLLGLVARRQRALAVPATFILLQAAVVVGMYRYFSGRQSAAWEREPDRR